MKDNWIEPDEQYKPWELPLPIVQEKFVKDNMQKILEYVETTSVYEICSRYDKPLEQYRGILISELYSGLRKVAYYCNNLDIAFRGYAQVTFRQTVEEYFAKAYRDGKKEPKINRSYYILQPEPKSEAIIDFSVIAKIIKKAGLTRNQKRVLLLRDNKGLRFQYIARKLGLQVSTVCTHYYRAIQKLQCYVKSVSIELEDVYRELTKAEKIELDKKQNEEVQ